ncbi:uncharacterized protein TNIN_491371, partial [Trichonephila inaurata madagascariensis]
MNGIVICIRVQFWGCRFPCLGDGFVFVVILQDCTVFESLSIAQELGIDELRMCCEDHINSTLNVHNACTFLPACLELENRIP